MSDSTMLIRRKGVCTNPDCEMCMTRTVQEIEPGDDFICADCGVPLKEVSDKTKSDKGPKKNQSKLLPIIAGAVVLLGGGGAAWWFLGDKSSSGNTIDIETIEFTNESIEVTPSATANATLAVEPADHNETLEWTSSDESVATVDNNGVVTGVGEGTATVSVKADRSGKDASVAVNVAKSGIKNPDPNPNPGTNPTTGPTGVSTSQITLNYGVYSGPVKAGKPDGMGGEFKFTRAMTLDLKDGYGTTVELTPGDKIITTKFTDGKLRQGEIHFANGTRKYISGLNQSL